MNNLLEERLAEEINRHASKLQAPEGINRGEVATALQQRASRRRRRHRTGLVAVACASLLTAGAGLTRIITNQDGNTTVVSNAEDETLRLLPSWTPEGTTVVVSGPEAFDPGSFASRVMVWGSTDRQVWLTIVGVGVGGSRPLETGLQELLGTSAVDPGTTIGIDWSVGNLEGPAASVSLSTTGATPQELASVARSLQIDPMNLVVTAPQLPLGLPLKYEGDGVDLRPAKRWYLRGGQVSLIAEIRNELRDSLVISGGPDGVQTVDVRGFKARLFKSKGTITPFFVTWSEGQWTLMANGRSEAEVLRFARSLRPATKKEWDSVLEKVERPPVIQRVPDAASESFSFATSNGEASVDMQLKTSDVDCVDATLQLPGVKPESICTPISIPPSGVLWVQLRTVGDRRFVVALLANTVDAVTVATATTPKPTTVSSGEVGATWVEGAVVKSSAGQFMWLGWIVAEVPTGAVDVALDLYESEASTDEVDTTEDPEAADVAVEDPNPISVDYPIRFVDRVLIE
jgi:hypothetical protein